MKPGIIATAFLTAAFGGVPCASAGAPAISLAVAGADYARSSALQLDVTGSPQADEISVALDSGRTRYVIVSTHAINPPPPPCSQISSFEIRCPSSEFASFSASLGAASDTFSVARAVRVPFAIDGGSGLDVLGGGSGSDTLRGKSGADRLLGHDGQDTQRGGVGRDVLVGGDGRDLLNGGAGADRLRGGAGTDVLKGGGGKDRLLGGKGRDVTKP